MHPLKLLGAAALLPMLAALIAGCTGIGYLVGHSVDHSQPLLPVRQTAVAAAAGLPAVLQTRAGATHAGAIVGLARMSESEYAARYASWRSHWSQRIRLPQLGDSIVVIDEERGEVRGRFTGFDAGNIRLGGDSTAMATTSALSDSAGGELDLAFLNAEHRRNALPVMTVLRFRVDASEIVLPIDEVALLRIEQGRSGRTTGTIAGGILDAALIVTWALLTAFGQGFALM